MQANPKWLVILSAGILILTYSISRDIRYSKEYPGDLRYRVVGARLVKDGSLPYFYKWKKGDGIRYYDPDNFDILKAANITVSPFYLHLLSPIADIRQAAIIYCWLVSEYLLLAGMTVFCFFLAKTTGQKQAVVLFSLLFLLTNAWKSHVSCGQTYLWIPFFAMLFFACIRRPGHFVWGFAAGAVAACFVLVRINAIFFFPPFLFLAHRYKRSWGIAFCLPPLLLAGWTLLDRQERSLWVDYGGMMKEYLKLNQDLDFVVQHNEPDPRFGHWEGVDKAAADKLGASEPDKVYSENGNVFVLFQAVFKRPLCHVVLVTAGVAIIGALLGCFYFLHRPFTQLSPQQVTIFAFCLYMISDLFSPIHRHQYYTTQWLFPLLLAAATWSSSSRTAYWLLAGCLLVSAIHLPFVKMGNTIAEYLLLFILLCISLVQEAKWPSKTRPASPPASA